MSHFIIFQLQSIVRTKLFIIKSCSDNVISMNDGHSEIHLCDKWLFYFLKCLIQEEMASTWQNEHILY